MKDRMKKVGGKKTGVAKRNMGKKTLSGPEVGMVGNLGGPSATKYDKTRKKRQFRMDNKATGAASRPGAYEGGGNGTGGGTGGIPGMARGKKTEMQIENFKDMMYKKFGGKT